jgi:HEAT repeat protein
MRVNAIEVVATTERVKLMPQVQRLLNDEFVPVRFAAALAIGDLEYTLAEREVSRLLNDGDENVRIAAAYAIGKLGSAESFEILREAIVSRDQTLRANAALLLGKSGDKRALKLLYITLRREDSDDKVRFQAAESIAMLGDERIVPKLWTMLISAYADVRVIGVKATGALGTMQARNTLATMLDDDVPEVRLAAAEQLGALGDKAGELVVLEVFTKGLTTKMDKRGVERVNVFAALAIGKIATPRLTKFLPRLLRDESKAVRLAAAKAVFECAMRGRLAEKLAL